MPNMDKPREAIFGEKKPITSCGTHGWITHIIIEKHDIFYQSNDILAKTPILIPVTPALDMPAKPWLYYNHHTTPRLYIQPLTHQPRPHRVMSYIYNYLTLKMPRWTTQFARLRDILHDSIMLFFLKKTGLQANVENKQQPQSIDAFLPFSL